jgi:hypothetical protein
MVPKVRVAGSLVLSLLNSIVVVAALSVGYSGLSPWWAAIALWVVPVPLIVCTTAYLFVDALKLATRKQALVALVILLPTVAVEWHFRFRGI